MKNFNLTVEVVREGQPRKYADLEYEYRIHTDCASEYCIKMICQAIRPCKHEFKEWLDKKEDVNVYFSGYYTLKKVGDNTYIYYVKEPFCD